MKKRIGTKLYDTDSAELITESVFGVLYRKRTRDREWFLINDSHVIPMTDEEARAMLGDTSYHPKPQNDSVMVRVDRETHNAIAKEAKRLGVSMTEAVKEIVTKALT